TATGGSGGMNVPAEQQGDTTLGSYHSHPYSKSEGSQLGVSFLATDITTFIGGTTGNFMYVAAGSCNFVLDTLDPKARTGCKTVDISKRWNDAFKAGSATFTDNVEAGVKAAIAGCGLCYYKACRPNDKSAVPKVATLVA